ncbi:hypothetical protein F503_00636 [Ophiostoma piceae UAMH 11346]|uniref:Uncharacterized protein n=1 Tax=Ophiostoma piceae (strain UAMH 11346) TaxID=1262450 RepID=S3C302_OPHP1|nr:hypothetical protein F503_00636 [Ophiostoma piceae UAMH 11346]
MVRVSYKEDTLVHGDVRVRWRCESCGKHLYDDCIFSPTGTSAQPVTIHTGHATDPQNGLMPPPRSILRRPVKIDAVPKSAGRSERPAQETTLFVADESPKIPVDPAQKIYLPIGYSYIWNDPCKAEQVELPDLQSDRDLFQFLRHPGWRFESAGQDAGKLLRPSIGKNELIHLLKHPACASNTSTRILQQLPRKLGKPACQAALDGCLWGVFFEYHYLCEKVILTIKFAYACVVVAVGALALRISSPDDNDAFRAKMLAGCTLLLFAQFNLLDTL